MCQIRSPCQCITLCTLSDTSTGSTTSSSSSTSPSTSPTPTPSGPASEPTMCPVIRQLRQNAIDSATLRAYSDELTSDINMDLDMGQFTSDTEKLIVDRAVVQVKEEKLRAETRDILARLDSASWETLIFCRGQLWKEKEEGLDVDESKFEKEVIVRLRTCGVHQKA